jgi:endonuclease YncB( thermonuclease family)
MLIRFLLPLILLPAIGVAGETLTGKVESVTDGDTIAVLSPEKREVKIRLDGIDAPERKQPYYSKSRKALGDLVAGREVLVEIKGEDRYKRKIGVVRLASTNVNEKLVRDGWAWRFVQYAKDNKALADAEQEARKERRGLWADSKPPVPPWESRTMSSARREKQR